MDSAVICSICVKVFVNVCDCQKHIQSHDEALSYQCANCNIGFPTTAEFEMHLKTQHEATDFACQLCNFIGESSDMIEKHNVKIHVHPCTLCQTKLFQSIELLRVHTEKEHTEQTITEQEVELVVEDDLWRMYHML